MASSGHAGAHFPGRMQPKQCYDSLIPKRRAWGSAREKSLTKVKVMAWTTPVFEEVVLCCEINSYVSAQL
jgi:coenzyme PQQ precursor peptide PqqA